jgi:hypothetical protein
MSNDAVCPGPASQAALDASSGLAAKLLEQGIPVRIVRPERVPEIGNREQPFGDLAKGRRIRAGYPPVALPGCRPEHDLATSILEPGAVTASASRRSAIAPSACRAADQESRPRARRPAPEALAGTTGTPGSTGAPPRTPPRSPRTQPSTPTIGCRPAVRRRRARDAVHRRAGTPQAHTPRFSIEITSTGVGQPGNRRSSSSGRSTMTRCGTRPGRCRPRRVREPPRP